MNKTKEAVSCRVTITLFLGEESPHFNTDGGCGKEKSYTIQKYEHAYVKSTTIDSIVILNRPYLQN